MHPTSNPRRPTVRLRGEALYLIAQGVAGTVWWGCLVGIPVTRDCFKPPDAPDWAILGFWLADLALFVVGSLLSGVLVLRGSQLASPVLWFTAGGVCYASLYCIGLSLLTGSTWLASACMLPAMGVTLWISIRYEKRSRP